MWACETIGGMVKFLAAAAVALLTAVLLGSGPAYAHAALLGTDPADGAHLTTAPTRIALTFSENIAKPAFVVLTAPDGKQVPTSDIAVVDNVVTATVAASDIKGTYSLSYRVVSADSHPVAGSSSFEVTTGRTVTPVAPTVTPQSFVHRHRDHLVWGVGAAAAAIALLLWPLRKRHD